MKYNTCIFFYLYIYFKFHTPQVSANDKDRAPPDDIRYSLRGQGQANGIFTINPKTGEIFVNKPLDRDPPAGQELYTLLTLATDDKGRGNYGYADVYIRLNDINDNAPRFDGNFEGTVDENTAPGLCQAMELDSATCYFGVCAVLL